MTNLIIMNYMLSPIFLTVGCAGDAALCLVKYHHDPICFTVAVEPNNHPRLVRTDERDSCAFCLRVGRHSDLDSRETEHGRRLLREGRKLVELAVWFSIDFYRGPSINLCMHGNFDLSCRNYAGPLKLAPSECRNTSIFLLWSLHTDQRVKGGDKRSEDCLTLDELGIGAAYGNRTRQTSFESLLVESQLWFTNHHPCSKKGQDAVFFRIRF